MPITLSSANAGVSAAGTNSLGISLTVASGDTLGVLVVSVDSGATPTTVQDSQGSNWVLANSVVGPGNNRVLVYYTLDTATTGSRTVTVNVASATNLSIGGAFFAGTKTSAVVDHSATNSGTGSRNINFSSTGSDSLLICVFGTSENDTYDGWGTGQIEFVDTAQGGGPSNRVSVGASYEIVTASGTNNQTLSGGINAWGCVAVEFLAGTTPDVDVNAGVNTAAFQPQSATINAKANVTAPLNSAVFAVLAATVVIASPVDVNAAASTAAFTVPAVTVEAKANIPADVSTAAFVVQNVVVNTDASVVVGVNSALFEVHDVTVALATNVDVNADASTAAFEAMDAVVEGKAEVTAGVNSAAFEVLDVAIEIPVSVSAGANTAAFGTLEANVEAKAEVLAGLNTAAFQVHDVTVETPVSVNVNAGANSALFEVPEVTVVIPVSVEVNADVSTAAFVVQSVAVQVPTSIKTVLKRLQIKIMGDVATPTYWVTADANGNIVKTPFNSLPTLLYHEFACSDEISDLEVGTVYEQRLLRAFPNCTAFDFGLITAPTGSTFIIDVQKNGMTVYTTKATIDAGGFTTLTAAVPQVITGGSVSFAAGDVLKIVLDQVGSTVPGANLKCQITYNN